MTASRRSLLGGLALGGAALSRGCAPVPAMAAGPDAELIRLCAGFDRLTRRFAAIYDGPDEIEDDDECERAGDAIAAEMRTILDRLCVLRATTLEGHLARARTLLAHDGQIRPDTLAASQYMNDRLLGMLLRDMAIGTGAA